MYFNSFTIPLKPPGLQAAYAQIKVEVFVLGKLKIQNKTKCFKRIIGQKQNRGKLWYDGLTVEIKDTHCICFSYATHNVCVECRLDFL